MDTFNNNYSNFNQLKGESFRENPNTTSINGIQSRFTTSIDSRPRSDAEFRKDSNYNKLNNNKVQFDTSDYNIQSMYNIWDTEDDYETDEGKDDGINQFDYSSSSGVGINTFNENKYGDVPKTDLTNKTNKYEVIDRQLPLYADKGANYGTFQSNIIKTNYEGLENKNNSSADILQDISSGKNSDNYGAQFSEYHSTTKVNEVEKGYTPSIDNFPSVESLLYPNNPKTNNQLVNNYSYIDNTNTYQKNQPFIDITSNIIQSKNVDIGNSSLNYMNNHKNAEKSKNIENSKSLYTINDDLNKINANTLSDSRGFKGYEASNSFIDTKSNQQVYKTNEYQRKENFEETLSNYKITKNYGAPNADIINNFDIPAKEINNTNTLSFYDNGIKTNMDLITNNHEITGTTSLIDEYQTNKTNINTTDFGLYSATNLSYNNINDKYGENNNNGVIKAGASFGEYNTITTCSTYRPSVEPEPPHIRKVPIIMKIPKIQQVIIPNQSKIYIQPPRSSIDKYGIPQQSHYSTGDYYYVQPTQNISIVENPITNQRISYVPMPEVKLTKSIVQIPTISDSMIIQSEIVPQTTFSTMTNPISVAPLVFPINEIHIQDPKNKFYSKCKMYNSKSKDSIFNKKCSNHLLSPNRKRKKNYTPYISGSYNPRTS